MRPWRFLALGLALGLAAGCRAPNGTAELEKENFELESKLYELDGHLTDAKRQLEACKKEKERLREQAQTGQGSRAADGASGAGGLPLLGPLGGAGLPAIPGLPERLEEPQIILPDVPPAANPPPVPIPGAGAATPPPPSQLVPRSLPPITPPAAEPPASETPVAAAPRNLPDRPATTVGPAPVAPPVSAPELDVPPVAPAAPQPEPKPLADNRQVAGITLDETVTGGFEGDQQPGDDGVSLCVQPRGEDGQFLRAPGAVSVVVVDPAAEAAAARVARWDVSAADAATALQGGFAREGIWVELPWPAAPPQHGSLKLFVRYTTDDGRQLETQQDIRIRLPGEGSVRWDPATSRSNPGQVVAAVAGSEDRWQLNRNPTPRETLPASFAEAAGPEPEPTAVNTQEPSVATRERPVWTPNRPK